MDDVEYFVDTNVFVRYFVKDSEQSFIECRGIFDDLAMSSLKAVTSSSVIAEIHWVLKSYYKLPKVEIVDYVSRILSIRNLDIDNLDSPLLANSIFQDSSVKFIDALIASHPRIQDGSMSVISYDKDFDKLGVKRMEPKSVLKSLRRRT